MDENLPWAYRESRDVDLLVAYIKKAFTGHSIGIIGVSLGGAASLLGNSASDVDALVLESVYSNIEKAVENRLVIYFGKAGRLLTPLLSWQIEASLGIPLESLSPISSIKKLTSPVMIIAGGQDRHTSPEETLAIYQAAPGKKILWLIDGAGHQDLHKFSSAEYQQKVLTFLQRYMH